MPTLFPQERKKNERNIWVWENAFTFSGIKKHISKILEELADGVEGI